MSIYLDGRSIRHRTDELNGAMFRALPAAILGSTAATAGPVLAYGFLVHKLSFEQPATQNEWIAAIAISVLCIVMGATITIPFFRRKRAVLKHAAALEDQTAKSGSGWADS